MEPLIWKVVNSHKHAPSYTEKTRVSFCDLTPNKFSLLSATQYTQYEKCKTRQPIGHVCESYLEETKSTVHIILQSPQSSLFAKFSYDALKRNLIRLRKMIKQEV